jgi:hypothetical protein
LQQICPDRFEVRGIKFQHFAHERVDAAEHVLDDPRNFFQLEPESNPWQNSITRKYGSAVFVHLSSGPATFCALHFHALSIAAHGAALDY